VLEGQRPGRLWGALEAARPTAVEAQQMLLRHSRGRSWCAPAPRTQPVRKRPARVFPRYCFRPYVLPVCRPPFFACQRGLNILMRVAPSPPKGLFEGDRLLRRNLSASLKMAGRELDCGVALAFTIAVDVAPLPSQISYVSVQWPLPLRWRGTRPRP